MTQKILKHKTVSAIFGLSFLLVIGGTLWTYIVFRNTSGLFILHFNDLGGIKQIGEAGALLWMGLLGFVATLINFYIALELEARDRFLGKMLAAGTLLLALLLFVGFAAIINVN